MTYIRLPVTVILVKYELTCAHALLCRHSVMGYYSPAFQPTHRVARLFITSTHNGMWTVDHQAQMSRKKRFIGG